VFAYADESAVDAEVATGDAITTCAAWAANTGSSPHGSIGT